MIIKDCKLCGLSEPSVNKEKIKKYFDHLLPIFGFEKDHYIFDEIQMIIPNCKFKVYYTGKIYGLLF